MKNGRRIISVACKKSPSVNQSCGPIFERPSPSGHRSDLRFSENNMSSDSVFGSVKVQEAQKNKAAVQRRKRKRKNSPVLYFLYRNFDWALQTPGRAFLNCPGIWRLNWASETPDSLSSFWGKKSKHAAQLCGTCGSSLSEH